MCVLFALLKVVNYYYLSVLSMSVMGFQKKKVWVGGVSSIGLYREYAIAIQDEIGD